MNSEFSNGGGLGPADRSVRNLGINLLEMFAKAVDFLTEKAQSVGQYADGNKSGKPSERTDKGHFIVIDDDPLYRAVIVRMCTRQGIKIDAFESVLELDTHGSLGKYDAAIVDFDLGSINGVEITWYLNALFGDVPVILVSEKERNPGVKGWPKSIKRFVHKSEGHSAVISEAVKYASAN